MSDSAKERFYFIQNKFIWNYFYTIGDYNKYLNTIRGLIGRCNRYFERWLYLIPQDFGMIHHFFIQGFPSCLYPHFLNGFKS